MRPDRRGQGVVQRLLVSADTFHSFIDEPLSGLLVKPGE